MTGLAAELRRACARGDGLPNANGGHWKELRGAGEMVVLLRWRRSSEDELVTAMATAEVRAELGCRCGEEDGAENGNEAQGDSGGRWRG